MADSERLCLSIFLGLFLLSLPLATSMDLPKEEEAENGCLRPCACNPLPTKVYAPPDGWWIVSVLSIVTVLTVTFGLSKIIYAVRPAPTVVRNNELSEAERLEERNRNFEKYYELLRNTTHEVPIFRGRI